MFEKDIHMVDLRGQYLRLKEDIDSAIQEVIDTNAFINGPQVKTFAHNLANFLDIPYVIPCANGTDAIQIAYMALELKPGDEIIIPAFNYIAAAEAAALLGLIPVFVDVDSYTYNIDNIQTIEDAVTNRTKAIVAVHLFGQCCDMEGIMRIADKYNLYVVEDNAQSIGAVYSFSSGKTQQAGTIGHIGTTSFFPSKPLACYGDGGAIVTCDPELAERVHLIANHGQERKYCHKLIGCNSRLDTIQAAILNIKLKHLHQFNRSRIEAAVYYNEKLTSIPQLKIPVNAPFSSHVYHQYTIQVEAEKRNKLQAYLKEQGIPSMIYYPTPLHQQEAFRSNARRSGDLHNASELTEKVLSIPIHTEMNTGIQDYIIEHLGRFFW